MIENDDATLSIDDANAVAQQPSEDAVTVGNRPDEVPEKFWNAETGTLRADALLKSYRELERRMSKMVPLPTEDSDEDGVSRLRRALGVPDSPEDYAITSPDESVAADAEINARLHAAGFSQEQAQLVYDLAAERLAPVVEQLHNEAQARQQIERLAQRFGGEQGWRETATQLRTWAQANLDDETYQTLSGSYEGVLALHHMMQAGEPSMLNGDGGAANDTDESELRSLMRDPRYWRDRDPTVVARVTDGFRRLYPD